MNPYSVIEFYRGLPAWARWLGFGVFIGALLVAAVWYFVTIPKHLSNETPGKDGLDVILEEERRQDLADIVHATVGQLEEERNEYENEAKAALPIAIDAATTADEMHRFIDDAANGDAVDDVIYGNRTDDNSPTTG